MLSFPCARLLVVEEGGRGGFGIASHIYHSGFEVPSIEDHNQHDQHAKAGTGSVRNLNPYPDVVITTSRRDPPQLTISIAYVLCCTLVWVQLPLVLNAFEGLKVA